MQRENQVKVEISYWLSISIRLSFNSVIYKMEHFSLQLSRVTKETLGVFLMFKFLFFCCCCFSSTRHSQFQNKNVYSSVFPNNDWIPRVEYLSISNSYHAIICSTFWSKDFYFVLFAQSTIIFNSSQQFSTIFTLNMILIIILIICLTST